MNTVVLAGMVKLLIVSAYRTHLLALMLQVRSIDTAKSVSS